MQLFFPSFFLFSRLMHTEENLKKSEEKYVTLKSNETAGNISKKEKLLIKDQHLCAHYIKLNKRRKLDHMSTMHFDCEIS